MPSGRRLRRRLSLTPLIDVIFLLLLFFMLSSTFSKFAEVELAAGGAGASATSAETQPVFLRLVGGLVLLNGQPVPIPALRTTATGLIDAPRTVLVSLDPTTNAQTLTDVLAALRGIDGASVVVLEG